ncbi:hypothetical protein Tco_1462853 [Tanacetum coccineum]
MSLFMKLLRHLWHGHKGTNSLLKRTSHASDAVTIKTLLLLYQIQISAKRNDMTLALLAPHNPQLHSHLPGRKDTDSAYFPKTKQRPKWLKPIPEEGKPATPKPD